MKSVILNFLVHAKIRVVSANLSRVVINNCKICHGYRPKNLLISGNLLPISARLPLKRYMWHHFLYFKYKFKARVLGLLLGDGKVHYFPSLR